MNAETEKHMVPRITVLTAAKNEEENITPLVDKMRAAIRDLQVKGEIIMVDDGSTDNTWQQMCINAEKHSDIRLFRNRITLGITSALFIGVKHMTGDFLFLFPADLESDPEEDIPKLYARIIEGYDVVVGYRQGRKDGKAFGSGIFNFIFRKLFSVELHDMNWIKGLRREPAQKFLDYPLYSGIHRFLIPIAYHHNYRITETETNWYPRKYGKTKFRWHRIFRFIIDLIFYFLWTSRGLNQLPLFIWLSIGCLILGFAFLACFLVFSTVYTSLSTIFLIIFLFSLFLAGLLPFAGYFCEVFFFNCINIQRFLSHEEYQIED